MSIIDNITLFLKSGKQLTTKEILFVNDINKALELYNHGGVYFKTEWLKTLFEDALIEFESSLKCVTDEKSFTDFENLFVYNVEEISENGNSITMNLGEFVRFVKERGVDTVFNTDYFVDVEDLTVTKEDIEIVFEGEKEEYIKEIAKICKADISTYNAILKKLDYDTPVEKEYALGYKGAIIKTSERSNCFIDSEEALVLICLKNIDSINDLIEE